MTSTSPPARISQQNKRPSSPKRSRTWSLEDLRTIQHMTAENSQDLLREFDARGLSPVSFAAFQAALTSDSLLPLLGLLEPKKGESKIDVLVEAIEKVLDVQKQILAEQVQIRSMLVAIGRRLPASK